MSANEGSSNVIFGRPTNLIIGAFTATFNVVVLVLAANGTPLDGSIVAGVNVAFAAVIALVANQPPTLSPGDQFTVQTATGQPNYQTTVATPPAADPPPAPIDGGAK
jgi:hypothetical protein